MHLDNFNKYGVRKEMDISWYIDGSDGLKLLQVYTNEVLFKEHFGKFHLKMV